MASLELPNIFWTPGADHSLTDNLLLLYFGVLRFYVSGREGNTTLSLLVFEKSPSIIIWPI